MRVDCYNACATPIENIQVGDNFYYADVLYMRVKIEQPRYEPIIAVDLARGVLTSFDSGTIVTKADAKVVCE